MFDGDRMNKMYSIKIEWSTAYECIVSLYVYLQEKERKHYQLGSEWKEKTAKLLPPDFVKELEDERWEVLHRLVLLVAQSPQKGSVEQFLDWLAQVPPGEIYERMAPWVDTIPLNLGEIRDHSLYLLTRWNEHYFSKVDDSILEKLEESTRRLTEQLGQKSPMELIDQVTNGIWLEPTADLQQIVLIPQFHCAPLSVLDFYRGMATCLYPVDDSTAVLQKLLPITQCLSDEKRLGLLRIVAERPSTLTELTQQIGLAKSTVHHHVTALRRAGLIRAHYTGSTTISYYSLRESFIDQLPSLLHAFLGKGDEA